MKPNKTMRRFLLALAACALTPLAAQASLILNGSFETVTPGPGTGAYAADASTVLDGWTLGAGASSEGLGCIYIANSWAGRTPTDGSIFTCLKFGASLSQTFNAPTSGSATLTFNYNEAINDFGNTFDAQYALEWYLDGSKIGDSYGSIVKGWVSQTDVLTLTAGPHTFMLKHNTPSKGDVISLDKVALNLTAVPEPGSLLALGCLIGSGALLRSRRR